VATFSGLTRLEQLPELFEATITFLQHRDAPAEALATLTKGRGIGTLRTAPHFVRVGQAWRLGVLLLDVNAQLYATGEVTRAVEPQLAVTNRSAAADRRREFRRAAVRGKFDDGETINHGFTPLELASLGTDDFVGPLTLRNDNVMVVWSAVGATGLMPLANYLAERAEILAPVGATD
jgi:hypothetical protein